MSNKDMESLVDAGWENLAEERKNSENFLGRLREANQRRSEEWNISEEEQEFDEIRAKYLIEMLFRSNEFAGEVGEHANEIKKLARYWLGMKGSITPEEAHQRIEDEMGDVLICLDRMAQFFGIDLERATINKFNKTSDKYGLDEHI